MGAIICLRADLWCVCAVCVCVLSGSWFEQGRDNRLNLMSAAGPGLEASCAPTCRGTVRDAFQGPNTRAAPGGGGGGGEGDKREGMSM